MPVIHPTAIVSADAILSDTVEIGPYCIVHEGVKLGAGTRLLSHAVIHRGTELGEMNVVHPGAVLGGDPQDRKYDGKATFLKIGNRNVFRECVTIHRATGEGKTTIIGDDNYIMAYAHFGHNCVLGNRITVANSVQVAGHCHIGDGANIGGLTAVHQFVRIGSMAMIGGCSRINQDCPPYIITEGSPAKQLDINAIGLRRAGISDSSRLALRKACKILYRSGLSTTNALDKVKAEIELTPEVSYLIDFVSAGKGGRYGRALDGR